MVRLELGPWLWLVRTPSHQLLCGVGCVGRGTLAKEAIDFFSWASLFIRQSLFYNNCLIGPVLKGTKLSSKGTHLPRSHGLWGDRQTEMDDYNAVWRSSSRDRSGNDGCRDKGQLTPDGQWKEPLCPPPPSSHHGCFQAFLFPTVHMTTVNPF